MSTRPCPVYNHKPGKKSSLGEKKVHMIHRWNAVTTISTGNRKSKLCNYSVFPITLKIKHIYVLFVCPSCNRVSPEVMGSFDSFFSPPPPPPPSAPPHPHFHVVERKSSTKTETQRSCTFSILASTRVLKWVVDISASILWWMEN